MRAVNIAVLSTLTLWLLWLFGPGLLTHSNPWYRLLDKGQGLFATEQIMPIDSAPGVDTSIVLINFGIMQRDGIAVLIERLAEENCAAIGVDALFFGPAKYPSDDSALVYALKKAGNVVLGCRLHQPWTVPSSRGQMGFDSVALPMPYFKEVASLAYLNLPTHGTGAIKGNTDIMYSSTVNGLEYKSLSLSMAEAMSAPAALLVAQSKKGKALPLPYYRGHKGYRLLEAEEVMGSTKPLNLKGKVVLIGFLGNPFDLTDQTDKFITPLNEDFGSIAPTADMFGLAIHANAVEALLRGQVFQSLHISGWWVLGLLFALQYVIAAAGRELPRFTGWLAALVWLLLVFSLPWLHMVLNHEFIAWENASEIALLLVIQPLIFLFYKKVLQPSFTF